MLTTESDAKCNNKKKNIGNDFVTIVYNESGQEYDIQTVKIRHTNKQLPRVLPQNFAGSSWKTSKHLEFYA